MSLPALALIDGVPVARMPADIDAASAAGLGLAVVESVAREAPHLVLDLSDTRYIDSVGIDMLFKVAEQLRRSRQQLRLAVPAGSPIRRVLEIAAVDRSIPLHADVGDAVAGGSEPTSSLA